MLLKKQNVFNDCIAAANYLINEGYTSANRLAVRGGSNGGLLVGAVITQRPDLFRAAVCEAPLLDMISLSALRRWQDMDPRIWFRRRMKTSSRRFTLIRRIITSYRAPPIRPFSFARRRMMIASRRCTR